MYQRKAIECEIMGLLGESDHRCTIHQMGAIEKP